jgi:hypothetical protein
MEEKGVIPLRPIVIGGDDLTLICRADFALEFVKSYLIAFEEESQKQFGTAAWTTKESKAATAQGLTACAGIAFVKASYPFHYAYDLAEALCGEAKKQTKAMGKALAPSCLMFHKVQDSFVRNFNEIRERELMPQAGISFEYGPYYCGQQADKYLKEEECGHTVFKLLDNLKTFKEKDGKAMKSHLRQWLAQLHEDPGAANQMMKRLKTLNQQAKGIPQEYECLVAQEGTSEEIKKATVRIPYYDMLSLLSIKGEED